MSNTLSVLKLSPLGRSAYDVTRIAYDIAVTNTLSVLVSTKNVLWVTRSAYAYISLAIRSSFLEAAI